MIEEFDDIFHRGVIPHLIKRRIIPNNKKAIPFNIIQHWHIPISNKNMPGMFHNILDNVANNLEFNFIFFDNISSEVFIRNNFGDRAVNAYLKLSPQQYKSDLLRLCAIYVHGGIYMDIKFKTIRPMIDYVNLNETLFAKNDWENKVFNGFFITKAKDPIILKCIEKIIEHVENNYYGADPHWPTGPGTLGDVMVENKYTVPNKIIHFVLEENNIHSIIDKRTNETILRQYKTYREEQNRDHSHKYYRYSWENKEIYNSRL